MARVLYYIVVRRRAVLSHVLAGIEIPSFQRVLNFYNQRSYFRWIERMTGGVRGQRLD